MKFDEFDVKEKVSQLKALIHETKKRPTIKSQFPLEIILKMGYKVYIKKRGCILLSNIQIIKVRFFELYNCWCIQM